MEKLKELFNKIKISIKDLVSNLLQKLPKLPKIQKLGNFPQPPKLPKIEIDYKKIGLVGLAVVLFFLVMDLNNRLNELSRLSSEQKEASTVIAVLESTKEELEDQMAYATSAGAVEKWAYEEGKMTRSGEKLVIPLVSNEITQTVIAEPTSTPMVVQNWEVWLALFKGK